MQYNALLMRKISAIVTKRSGFHSLLLDPLNDLYDAGCATGYVESAALYGKRDEAIRKMRKSHI
jgi:hypothetical protein